MNDASNIKLFGNSTAGFNTKEVSDFSVEKPIATAIELTNNLSQRVLSSSAVAKEPQSDQDMSFMEAWVIDSTYDILEELLSTNMALKEVEKCIFSETTASSLEVYNFPYSQNTAYGVAQLMTLTDNQWKDRPFSQINQLMKDYTDNFTPAGKIDHAKSFLEKQDLPPDSEVAVIGDIHGNGLRLDLTLKGLQENGYLDEEFKCFPDKYIVFLGDYMDRGENNLKVLELLITFKQENRDHVFLVRGNHENVKMVKNNKEQYAKQDPKYYRYILNASNRKILNTFYKSLPAAVYLGQKTPGEKKRQYMQYCHGLFHLYTDPNPLLQNPDPHAFLWLPEAKSFSTRIQQLQRPLNPGTEIGSPKMQKALKKLDFLKQSFMPKFKDVYWFDIGDKLSNLNNGRKTITPQYVNAYLRVCSTRRHKVKGIFRGHQQGGIWFKGHKNKKSLITTIDPSQLKEKQLYMRIKLAQKIRDYVQSQVSIPMIKDHKKALTNMQEIMCSDTHFQ